MAHPVVIKLAREPQQIKARLPLDAFYVLDVPRFSTAFLSAMARPSTTKARTSTGNVSRTIAADSSTARRSVFCCTKSRSVSATLPQACSPSPDRSQNAGSNHTCAGTRRVHGVLPTLRLARHRERLAGVNVHLERSIQHINSAQKRLRFISAVSDGLGDVKKRDSEPPIVFGFQVRGIVEELAHCCFNPSCFGSAPRARGTLRRR